VHQSQRAEVSRGGLLISEARKYLTLIALTIGVAVFPVQQTGDLRQKRQLN
jgi:hypothetical protein